MLQQCGNMLRRQQCGNMIANKIIHKFSFSCKHIRINVTVYEITEIIVNIGTKWAN